MSLKRSEYIAPEGGWGYVIAATVVIVLTITVGHLPAFGIIYKDFLAQFGNKLEEASVANAIFFSCFSIVALIANQLLKKYPARYVGFLASFLIILGSFCNIFVKSVTQFYITYGILQGSGAGIAFQAMYKSFNEYFITKRNVVFYTCQSIFAVISIATPYIVQILMNNFGFRGTLAIFAALYSNMIIVSLLMHPVQWHMPKNNQKLPTGKFITNDEQTLDCICHNLEISNKIPNNEYINPVKKTWHYIYEFLELSLLKDPIYVNISFGLALTTVSDLMFLTLLPTYLQNLHFDEETVTFLMTIYMTADFVGRLILTVISAFYTFNNRYLLLLGTVTISIVRTIFTTSINFYGKVLICIIILGLLRCLLELTIPLVLIEYSRIRFNGALALYEIINCLLHTCASSLSKFIVSLNIDDNWMIQIYTFFLLVCFLLWIIEFVIIYVRNNSN